MPMMPRKDGEPAKKYFASVEDYIVIESNQSRRSSNTQTDTRDGWGRASGGDPPVIGSDGAAEVAASPSPPSRLRDWPEEGGDSLWQGYGDDDALPPPAGPDGLSLEDRWHLLQQRYG